MRARRPYRTRSRNRAQRAAEAATQIEKDKKLIEKYKDYGTTVKRLQREIDYLKGAVAVPPTVQLYLYDPAESRIIEMIGTPGADTKHVITYVPGTFTNLASFYDKAVQGLPEHLQKSRGADTVAFVYKDGVFPGASDDSDSLDFARILEANNEPRALEAGKTLAEFSASVQLDPDMSGRRAAVLAHSWGFAAATASEVAGARYDNIISLSGAGLPHSWTASPGTKYTDLSYPDWLQEVHLAGGDLIWGGNIPRTNESFNVAPYFEGPKDAYFRLPDGTPIAPDQGVFLSNHSLIASSDAGNDPVVNHLKSILFSEDEPESAE